MKDADVERLNLQRLRAMPVPSTSARAPGTGVSFGDRRSILLDEYLPLIDAAARNADSFQILRSCFPSDLFITSIDFS